MRRSDAGRVEADRLAALAGRWWWVGVPDEVRHEMEECGGCAEAEVLSWAMWRKKEQMKSAPGPWEVQVLQRDVVEMCRKRREVLEKWEESDRKM